MRWSRTAPSPRWRRQPGAHRRLRHRHRSAGPERVYLTDPIPLAPQPGGHATTALSEILPAGDGTLLVRSRAYAKGAATRSGYTAPTRRSPPMSPGSIRCRRQLAGMQKTLLLDFGTLGVVLDNFEAMGWGRIWRTAIAAWSCCPTTTSTRGR